jgi:hypothetical protein
MPKGSASAPEVVLVDSNAIIEAVRTRCWAAITGQLRIETVEACRAEVRSGSPETIPGYVRVTEPQLARMKAVHRVREVMRAALAVAVEDLPALDRGEADLLAHAYHHREQAWVLCSPDKAAIRAAVSLEMGDRLCSLEALADRVGARPRLRVQFREAWLRSFRTSVRMEGL